MINAHFKVILSDLKYKSSRCLLFKTSRLINQDALKCRRGKFLAAFWLKIRSRAPSRLVIPKRAKRSLFCLKFFPSPAGPACEPFESGCPLEAPSEMEL